MRHTVRVRRSTWLVAPLIATIILGLSLEGSARQMRLSDLHDQLVDPFQAAPDVKVIVFLFISTDCPISNRYAPELRRLYDKFTSRGVGFWLVYPNQADSTVAIRKHTDAFGYGPSALRDPQQALVKLANVTVTPEAAVFDRRQQLVYRGRIDNRYVNLGVERPAPTTHDLEEVLLATLAGQAVAHATAPAVGCFVADFLR